MIDRAQRDRLIELLQGLGADDPETVCDNARAAARLVEDSGLSWADLIPPVREGGVLDSDFDHGDFELDDDSTPVATDGAIGDVVEALRRLSGLADETRAELDEFAEAITSGTLDAQDERYIRALAARLRPR